MDQRLLIPGRPDHIDPLAWRPLIMKFAEFFGAGPNLNPSRLARGFGMNHSGTGIQGTDDDVDEAVA